MRRTTTVPKLWSPFSRKSAAPRKQKVMATSTATAPGTAPPTPVFDLPRWPSQGTLTALQDAVVEYVTQCILASGADMGGDPSVVLTPHLVQSLRQCVRLVPVAHSAGAALGFHPTKGPAPADLAGYTHYAAVGSALLGPEGGAGASASPLGLACLQGKSALEVVQGVVACMQAAITADAAGPSASRARPMHRVVHAVLVQAGGAEASPSPSHGEHCAVQRTRVPVIARRI